MTGAQGATRCAVASAHTLQAGPSLAGSATEADLMSLRGRPRLSAYLRTWETGQVYEVLWANSRGCDASDAAQITAVRVVHFVHVM